LVTDPREDLDIEYKRWLDLSKNEHRATIAKAAIALVNHGGGFIVLGFQEEKGHLSSLPRPVDVPDVTQDAINAAVSRYAAPTFHCEVHRVVHPVTKVAHPVVVVPGTLTEPVMTTRECSGILSLNRCYIRKPGPRSEEPKTGEEWRTLLNRCVRAGREEMLEAIRSIVSGRVSLQNPQPTVQEQLAAFCLSARERIAELTASVPPSAGCRFPYGAYEMGFALVDAEPVAGLSELQERLRVARRIKLTGWTPFLEIVRDPWVPYPHEDLIEAWVGRPSTDGSRDSAHSDFWRASKDGMLYTMRGYQEDSTDYPPGTVFDITLPVWRVGEGLLFASRLAETFTGTSAIAIECRFAGLEGRRMISLSGSRAVFGEDKSHSNEIVLRGVATLQQVKDNLVEVLHQLLIPLYERFDFFRLPATLVDEELNKMARGRF
jgi:hypothetical protein